jgi:hypothetical protein
MGEFKYWMVGRNRVHIIERFGTSTLVEYVKTGVQASVNTSLVKSVTTKPYVAKNPKKEAPTSEPAKNKKNNTNNQTSLDL